MFGKDAALKELLYMCICDMLMHSSVGIFPLINCRQASNCQYVISFPLPSYGSSEVVIDVIREHKRVTNGLHNANELSCQFGKNVAFTHLGWVCLALTDNAVFMVYEEST
jgi:hypothetical protein